MKKFPAILCALVLCLMCATAMAEGESHPKYVFMFIGDGMGNPQVTATQYYLGSIEKTRAASSRFRRICLSPSFRTSVW